MWHVPELWMSARVSSACIVTSSTQITSIALRPVCLWSNGTVRLQVVDIIMQATWEQHLREVAAGEAEGEPLLVMACGHALLLSSMDGHMEMDR